MARPFSSAQFGVNNPNTVLKTDADAEQAWNPLDILKAGDLNGFIAWCTRYAISSSNEIANALTNFQITPNEANESQLSGLLQNLDQKIDNAATAGAIIGSFWFGKTKSATVVPNPNNQAENYYDFTTNTPYKATASLTWEADTPLVPPTNRDARIIITKQFVDIQETENSGGTAYWSYTEGVWSYYPTVATGAVPVGTIVAYSTSTPPTGWLICDGSAVSQTTYASLFSVIGTTYSTGVYAYLSSDVDYFVNRSVPEVGDDIYDSDGNAISATVATITETGFTDSAGATYTADSGNNKSTFNLPNKRFLNHPVVGNGTRATFQNAPTNPSHKNMVIGTSGEYNLIQGGNTYAGAAWYFNTDASKSGLVVKSDSYIKYCIKY